MSTIERYWDVTCARDWASLSTLLAEDVVYDLPQTRERICGRDLFLRFNAEYPGDWQATLERVHGDAAGGASWMTVTVGAESMSALTFFRFDDAGLITHITDFWPTPYEPPAGREHLVQRY